MPDNAKSVLDALAIFLGHDQHCAVAQMRYPFCQLNTRRDAAAGLEGRWRYSNRGKSKRTHVKPSSKRLLHARCMLSSNDIEGDQFVSCLSFCVDAFNIGRSTARIRSGSCEMSSLIPAAFAIVSTTSITA